jgi:crossover junction endodeoxyribonuclease RuvC
MEEEDAMIGIDPGQSGGIVKLDDRTGEVIFADKFADKTEHDIAELIREFACSDIGHDHVWIEKVHSMPKQGVASTFKFGRNFGFLIGLLTGLRVRYDLVTPAKWQGAMNCRTKGDKNISKAAAQRRWPDRKWTHATADAALIAEYGRLQNKDAHIPPL